LAGVVHAHGTTQGGVTPVVQRPSTPNSAIVVTRNATEGVGVYPFSVPRLPGNRPHAPEVSAGARAGRSASVRTDQFDDLRIELFQLNYTARQS
jgi:hypothetical protein